MTLKENDGTFYIEQNEKIQMNIIEHAKSELDLINFGKEDTKVMIEILEKFFDTWDSGGTVWSVAPILAKCIAGKCLSPLTGEADEWMEVDTLMFQNKRLSTVFWNKRTGAVYDIDNPEGWEKQISFPYYPEEAKVSSPIVEVEI